MYDHIGLKVRDVEASARFDTAASGALLPTGKVAEHPLAGSAGASSLTFVVSSNALAGRAATRGTLMLVTRSRLWPPRLCATLLVVIAACAPRDLGAAAPIRSSERLAVEGAELFLEIRSADRRAPVLLWLHGGPGGAERPLFRHFNGALEDHFVVAYLDQRGAGRSFDPEAEPRQLTIARHLADLDAVVDHLRRSFGRDEIVLVGHSWGGALGLLYAEAHPEKVSAFIGVAPVICTRAGQKAEHEFVAAEAMRRKDDAALAKLQEIGGPPYDAAAKVLAIERLTERYGGVFHQAPNRAWLMLSAIFGGLVTPWEIPRLIQANNVSLEAMNAELLELDLSRSAPSVAVPVFFFLGRYDRHVDSRLAAAYLETLRAPTKKLLWFESSAHNVPFEEPERFDAAVVEELRGIGVE